MAKPKPSRYAAALQYLQQMRDRAADFGGGVVDTLADRARDVGGLAYEAFTSDPNIGRMTTAEFSKAAADRPSTPRLDATAQGVGALGKALVTQPVQTAKAVVVDPVVEAFESPRSMGQFAGEFVNPLRIAAALRKTAPIAELDVYHGTPHRFEPTEENPLGEFDASKVGTGEGAQAYGHGIYFAESPDVAKTYQSAQSPPARKATMALQATDGNVNKAIAAIKKEVATMSAHKDSPYLRQGAFQETQDALNYLQQMKKGAAPQTGALYTADLPDEMIDRMLDWDKPLSEQPEAVQQAIEMLKPNMSPAWQKQVNPKTTGQSLYIAAGSATNRPSNAAMRLKDVGIPGIRYLDAGSRGKSASGTRNFVVFPGEEKKVKILKRD
jgi:hypothetical protein